MNTALVLVKTTVVASTVLVALFLWFHRIAAGRWNRNRTMWRGRRFGVYGVCIRDEGQLLRWPPHCVCCHSRMDQPRRPSPGCETTRGLCLSLACTRCGDHVEKRRRGASLIPITLFVMFFLSLGVFVALAEPFIPPNSPGRVVLTAAILALQGVAVGTFFVGWRNESQGFELADETCSSISPAVEVQRVRRCTEPGKTWMERQFFFRSRAYASAFAALNHAALETIVSDSGSNESRTRGR